jgi:alpha-tubulin suppressor-like RCC1 family protein
VLSDGTVECLGGAPSSQYVTFTTRSLSSGDTLYLPAVDHVAKISLGPSDTCVLLEDAAVVCFGLDTDGELGDGPHGGNFPAQALGGLPAASAIGMGDQMGCALDLSGGAHCWGQDENNGYPYAPYSPISGAIDQLGVSRTSSNSDSYQFVCALQDGGVSCFGHNTLGQLGRVAPGALYHGPAAVTGLPPVTSMRTATHHSCALDLGGAAWCWGQDLNGELGVAAPVDAGAVNVPALSGLLDIAPGAAHTCALDGDGGVVCWGSNMYGQLGADAGFIPVTGLPPSSRVFAGGYDSCALSGNQLWCWGDRHYTQPAYIPATQPVVMPFP